MSVAYSPGESTQTHTATATEMATGQVATARCTATATHDQAGGVGPVHQQHRATFASRGLDFDLGIS